MKNKIFITLVFLSLATAQARQKLPTAQECKDAVIFKITEYGKAHSVVRGYASEPVKVLLDEQLDRVLQAYKETVVECVEDPALYMERNKPKTTINKRIDL